jgi:hypothetical protein
VVLPGSFLSFIFNQTSCTPLFGKVSPISPTDVSSHILRPEEATGAVVAISLSNSNSLRRFIGAAITD